MSVVSGTRFESKPPGSVGQDRARNGQAPIGPAKSGADPGPTRDMKSLRKKSEMASEHMSTSPNFCKCLRINNNRFYGRIIV